MNNLHGPFPLPYLPPLMVESRGELLSWLNDLLQINYTSIAEAGTGAAYCQIMDAIFGDVRMSRVKFQATHHEAYLTNYKILQSIFDKHEIEKVIDVENLMRCKVQDNLEFLQWCKRFWEKNVSDDYYDAVQRRQGRVPAPRPTQKQMVSSRNSVSSGHSRSGTTGNNVDFRRQVVDLKAALGELEKERDFYFGKLRNIEIYVQELMDTPPSNESELMLKEIQNILYKLEEGFEVPTDECDETASY